MTLEVGQQARTQLPSSPYRGLMPFTEADADFFFGRESEVRLIANTAKARRLGVLYGPSGVGKSSVLQAGVLRQIRDENKLRYERFGAVETVVAYLKEWRDDPFSALLAAVRGAFATMPGATPLPEQPGSDVVEEILSLRAARTVDLVLILDQFEEFFLYHRDRTEEFAGLLETLTERGTRVNVLISLREDALALLDEFQADVPAVLNNRLGLEHLDAKAAEDAIRRPLDHYNAQVPEAERMAIEDGLVRELLSQVRTGRVQVDSSQEALEPASPAHQDATLRVEAPYLQLVLTRLWDEETGHGSSLMRLTTLRELGGAQRIVEQHLNRVMRGFTPPEMQVLADAFGHLVTPSGSKIAHRPSDLAEFSRNDQAVMAALLHRLTEPGRLILREVPPPLDDPNAEPRYEIFHDVLALAVLDWRRRFLAEADAQRQQAELIADKERVEQEARETRHRLRKARLLAISMAFLLVACAALAAGSVYFLKRSQDAETKAVNAQTQAEQESLLSDVNRELLTDPSQALATARGLKLDKTHDRKGRSQDALRKALEAADTDVVLDLGSPVWLASFVEDKGVVALTHEGRLLVWDLVQDDPIRVDETPRVDVTVGGQVTGAVTAASESFVVVQTLTGISAVDLGTGDVKQFAVPDTFGDAYAMTVAPGGPRDQVLVHDYSGHMVVWGVADDAMTTLDPGVQANGVAAIDPSGKYVGAIVWDEPYRVVVWKVANRNEVASTPVVSFVDPDAAINDAGLAFTTTGSAVVADDPVLLLTPVTSQTEAALWDVLHDAGAGPTPLGGDEGTRWRVLYDTADLATDPTVIADDRGTGRIAMAGDKTVTVFNQNGTLQAQTAAGQDWKTGVVTNPVDQSVFAAAANEGYVQLYRTNLDPPQPMWTFRGHAGPVNDLSFSADGQHLVTAGADGTVRVWRLPPQMDFDWYIPDWILAARYTADGRYVFGYSPRFGYVTRQNRDGKIKSLNPTLAGMAVDMDPAPDGARAAVVDYFCGPPVEISMTKAEVPDLVPPEDGVCASTVAWNPVPEANQVVAGTYDGRVVSWNADTGEVTDTAQVDEAFGAVSGLEFAGDGETLVVSTGAGSLGRVYVLDASDLKTSLADWEVPDIRTLDVSADGSYVAVAGANRHVVKVWDTEDLDAKPLELTQASGSLGQVTISPDEDATRVAVTTSEGAVYVWDRESARLLAVMSRHGDAADEAAFDPEDIDHMSSAGDDGFMVSYTCDLCSMDIDDLTDAAADRVAQTVTLDD